MGPVHEKQSCQNSSHVMSMGMLKQGHILDTEKFIASGSFPLKSGKLYQCKAPPST